MARFITILEDDTARSSSMFELLADRLPEYEPLVFRRAREMIKWLGRFWEISSVVIWSLRCTSMSRLGSISPKRWTRL